MTKPEGSSRLQPPGNFTLRLPIMPQTCTEFGMDNASLAQDFRTASLYQSVQTKAPTYIGTCHSLAPPW